MERIISYNELPQVRGQSIYLRMETDPRLYITLMSKGYRLVRNISEVDKSTIYVTGRRQDPDCTTFEEYKIKVHNKVEGLLRDRNITKPNTYNFSYQDLVNHKYELPFVLKNENQNGGREKFLIQTEEDYEKLVKACTLLLDKRFVSLFGASSDSPMYRVDYAKYLESNFTVQDYIETPSKYNTTVRLLTSSSKDLLYGSLKYNEAEELSDNTSLVGILLTDVYPLSTKSIVSNTLSGGKNILLYEDSYLDHEKELLKAHGIETDKFHELVQTSEDVHEQCESELGIICGFDYIYDREKDKWFLLEYHSRPMVGDYSKRQGIAYDTKDDRITAEGRVRATALVKKLER